MVLAHRDKVGRVGVSRGGLQVGCRNMRKVGGSHRRMASGVRILVSGGWRTVSNKKRTSSAPSRPESVVGRGDVGQQVLGVEKQENDVFAVGALPLSGRGDETMGAAKDVKNQRAKISSRHFPHFLPLTIDQNITSQPSQQPARPGLDRPPAHQRLPATLSNTVHHSKPPPPSSLQPLPPPRQLLRLVHHPCFLRLPTVPCEAYALSTDTP